ncbi:MAG: 50S ribosomal protein L22 [Firmicutes bacterium]|nr:50S ribosomal protein L22 [Bacillota bacterium]MCL1954181.1 50S ribosomal protein L22 [Bacillota bacterium]
MATRIKQKTLALQENRDRRPTAHARYIRISPYKVRTVLALVRGLPVNQALAILRNMPRGASEVVFKLLSSAIANAENNLNLDRETLYVAEITASQGPTLKRMLPKAKGSSSRILKRTSHLTVKLDEISDDKIIDVKATKPAKVGTTKKTTKTNTEKSKTDSKLKKTDVKSKDEKTNKNTKKQPDKTKVQKETK